MNRPPTEARLADILQSKLTETYLRETLMECSEDDERGRVHTDLKSAAATMADWLAQELAEALETAPETAGA